MQLLSLSMYSLLNLSIVEKIYTCIKKLKSISKAELTHYGMCCIFVTQNLFVILKQQLFSCVNALIIDTNFELTVIIFSLKLSHFALL